MDGLHENVLLMFAFAWNDALLTYLVGGSGSNNVH